MGIGLGDIFKTIVEELGEDATGSAFKMLFDEKKNEFPIPLKKPFWEENKKKPEIKPKKEMESSRKETEKSTECENPSESSKKTDMKNNEKSLEAQLAKIQKDETTYEYITSLEEEEIKRGIIMAEILGKPRCKNRIRRRF